MNSLKLKTTATIALAAALLLLATDAFTQLVIPQVTFTSNVRGATVFVNEQERGTTPLTLGLRAGSYNIRLVQSGRSQVARTIRVDNTGRQTFQINFDATPQRAGRRQVTVNSNVPATVSIDGRARGATPLTLALAAGQYQLQLDAPGYSVLAVALAVSNQSRRSYTFELQPAVRQVTVNTNVPATVAIDGQTRGGTPLSIPLAPGEHQLLLSAPGYIQTAGILVVSDQSNQSYLFDLLPALATIVVDVPDQFLNKRLPDVATARGQVQLFVDGNRMDNTRFVEVPAGTRTIMLLSGGVGLSQQVELQAGLEYTVRLFASMEVLQTGVAQQQTQRAQQRGR